MTTIRYSTGKTYDFGREPVTFYTADVDDLRINLDRDPTTRYLPWCVFITRTCKHTDEVTMVYHNYAQTLREAKAKAAAYAEADQILKHAV